jgi:hypothetical protein
MPYRQTRAAEEPPNFAGYFAFSNILSPSVNQSLKELSALISVPAMCEFSISLISFDLIVLDGG